MVTTMRGMAAKFLLGLALVHLPAMALANCDLHDQLTNLTVSEARYSRASNLPERIAARGGLMIDLAAIDTDALPDLLVGRLSDHDINRVMLYLDYASAMVAAPVEITSATQMLTARAEFKQARNVLTLVLPKIQCTSDGNAGENIGDTITPGILGAPSAGRGIKIVASLMPYIIGIGIVAFLALSAWFLGMLEVRRKRRARRYTVTIETNYIVNTNKYVGAILDISQNGVKIRHEPSDDMCISAQISTQIGGTMRPGVLIWQNEHYCGVRFNKRIPSADLRAILDEHGINQPTFLSKTQKAAP